ncbi:hypothetical protein [Faecalispora jeddahensis]|uniref:hypothetical protein n=1 Tax=Faecalispora jeddahensis TaxID=1414721 RepID=UPI0004B689F2|nr:hypothetical protein [Faecalispora jeddahensis]
MNKEIVEVVEVIGAENAKPYTDKGWIVLGVLSCAEPPDYNFIYSLGKTLG